MLYEKLLEVAGVDTFAGENRCFADLDCRWPVSFCNDGQTWSRKISMRRCLGFCLQNVPGVEEERVQVRQIWRPIRQKPKFR
jgi:hypothetical protein